MRLSSAGALLLAMGISCTATPSLAQVPQPPILLSPNAATSFPDATTTGVPAGVTLTPCNGHLSTQGATYDRCLFSNGINLTAKNVTITRSKVVGVVAGNYIRSNLRMVDVEIDGNNHKDYDATHGLLNYTCVRCKVHNIGKCFSGSGFTVEDSYCYDLYTYVKNGEPIHGEPVLGSGTDGITLRGNNFVGAFNSASTGPGGLSAVIALYSHGDFWGPLDNVLVEGNRFENLGGAGYCVYAANSVSHNPSNIRFIDNVWAGGPNGGCKRPVWGWYRSSSNVWSGNRFDTGEPIPEPQTNDYY